MRRRDLVFGAAAVASLGACSAGPSVPRYRGPPVTAVVVNKADRRMFLVSGSDVLERYDISLGFAPEGHKQFEGDGRTPEGVYRIDRRNPYSRFHLSLGISYPNTRDKALAEAVGRSPGGDIFIHGQQHPRHAQTGDWTWGCIAVRNHEIEQIYAMVQDDTLISLHP